MSQAVVDPFEIVQVEKQDRHLVFIPPGMGHGHAEPVVEQHPVGQAGQGVVVRLIPQLLFVQLDFGHVMEHADIVHDISLDIADGGNDQPLGIDLSILAPVPDLPLPLPGFHQSAPHLDKKTFPVPVRLEDSGILPDHLLRPVTGYVRKSPVYPLNNPVGIGDHNALDAVFKDIVRQHQLLGGVLRLGDVLDNAHEMNGPAMLVPLDLGLGVHIPFRAIRADYTKLPIAKGISGQQTLQPRLHLSLLLGMDIAEKAFIGVGPALLVHPEQPVGLLGTDKIVFSNIPFPVSEPGDILGSCQAFLAAPQAFLDAPPFENLLVEILIGFGQIHRPLDHELLKTLPIFFQLRITLAKRSLGRRKGLICPLQFPMRSGKGKMQRQKSGNPPRKGQDDA